MKTKAMAAAALSCVLLSACGGEAGGDGADANAGSRSAKAEDALLKFAQCMRRQGVDVGDPGEGGFVRVGPGGEGAAGGEPPNPAKFRRAQQACEKYLREAGPPPELSEEQQEEFERKAIAFARCMREQGIDLPDPETSADGRVAQELPAGAAPESARFRDAEKACRKVGPQPQGAREVTP
jgi:hypothetical protein